MENIFVKFLPPWVETGLQPAFYDKESGTVLQQTARMYARVNMLIRMFNKLSKNTNNEINRFETEVNETVNDYIERFNTLYTYVHDYFDNLDVQEEINNKLDDMAEAGTLQEIITAYIQANVAWCFDTVADMKLAENLVSGSYAQTLGFYNKDDGGGAIYYITDTGTANEMNVIAVGDLYATLVTNKIANALQFGAIGDGVADDTDVLQAVLDYANTNQCKVLIPNKTYLTDSLVCDDVIDVQIEGTINLSSSSQSLTIQNDVNNGKQPNIFISKVTTGSIILKGVNSGFVNIQYADKLTLLADATTGHSFIGYTTFKLGYIKNLEIADDGSASKWVNENLFIGGRFQSVSIGEGSSVYPHQNNLFLEPMCEHTTWSFGKAKANRIIKARLEGTCTINFSADAFANSLEQDYKSDPAGYYFPDFVIHSDITINDLSHGKNSVVCNKNLKTVKHLVSIDKFNNPNSQTVEGEYLKPGRGKLLYQSEITELPSQYFLIYLRMDNPNVTFRIRTYDANKQLLTTNPSESLLESTGVISLQSASSYGNASYNRNDYWALIKPNNPDIKYIDIRVYTASNTAAETATYKSIDFYLTSYEHIDSYVIDGLGKMTSNP